MQKKITQKEKREIAEAYVLGESPISISVVYGWSCYTVYRVLKQANIPLRPNIGTRYAKEISGLYMAGETVVSIGELYGVSTTTVYEVLRRTKTALRQQVTYSFDTHLFDTIDTENKAYMLGFLYADGYNGGEKKSWAVKIDLAVRDEELLHKFKHCLSSNHPIRLDKRGCCSLSMHNRHFSNRLTELGCHNRKTFTLTFPAWMPEQLLPHFIRGYIDGDGWIHFNGKSVGVGAMGTIAFIEQLVGHIKANCGVHAYIRPHASSPGIVSCTVSGRDQVSTVLAWLYKDATLYLERKKRKAEAVLSPVYYNHKPNGSNCHLSSLNEAVVLLIRDAILAGRSNKQILIDFALSKEQLNDIRSGRTWHHITGWSKHKNYATGPAKGETHGMVKITEKDVLQIKASIEGGESFTEIANRYGITRYLISKIRCGKAWSHLTGYSIVYRGKARKGEENNNAKFTADQVRAIRELLSGGRTGRSLAKEYGVSSSLISSIKTGKGWSHVQ